MAAKLAARSSRTELVCCKCPMGIIGVCTMTKHTLHDREQFKLLHIPGLSIIGYMAASEAFPAKAADVRISG